jgi:hypothetical protein
MPRDIAILLADPFVSAANRFGSQIPTLAAALLLLILGLFAARALRTITERLLAGARLDEYTARVGINEIFARLGLGKSPTYVVSFLIYWFILFIFIVSAANAVNMTIVSDLLERFVLFLPVLVASILILFGGLIFGRFLSQVVVNAAAANNVKGGLFLAQAAYVVTLVFSAATALEQLGMKLTLIASALQIMLGSAGLAAAIAFGFGGRKAAADVLQELFDRPRR